MLFSPFIDKYQYNINNLQTWSDVKAINSIVDSSLSTTRVSVFSSNSSENVKKDVFNFALCIIFVIIIIQYNYKQSDLSPSNSKS